MIKSIECWNVEIPLKIGFQHAQYHHRFHRCIYVRVNGVQSGIYGLGECIPRSYLTGETLDQVMDWLRQKAKHWLQVELSLSEDIHKMLEFQYQEASEQGHLAASSGLDIALYDWWSRAVRRPLIELLPLESIPFKKFEKQTLPINAPVGLGPFLKSKIGGFLIAGFRRFKIKIADMDGWLKFQPLAIILTQLGCEVIVDCNGAFSLEQARKLLAEASESGVAAVEEPLKRSANSLNDLKALVYEFQDQVSLIVDEHFCSFQEGHFWADTPVIRNLRLAKNGGFTGGIHQLRLVKAVSAEGRSSKGRNSRQGFKDPTYLSLPILSGSLVGEGLLMENASKLMRLFYSPQFVDPAWGTFLLSTNPQGPENKKNKIKFNRLENKASQFQSPDSLGLGVKFHEDLVRSYCCRYEKWSKTKKIT